MPQTDLPVQSLYRVSHLQMAAKYDISNLHGKIGFNDFQPNEIFTILTEDTRAYVKIIPLNFSPVSGIINCFGRFTLEYVKFFPSMLQGRSPIEITINNLRDIVVLLSDPNTGLEVRQAYVNLNSIPAVKFNDEQNPILVNPDDIMPADYGINTIRQDFQKIKALLAIVGRKLPKMVGSVTFDEKGNPGQLLSTEIYRDSPRIVSFVEFNDNNGAWFYPIDPYITGDVRSLHENFRRNKQER
ncbi:hypothetical protein CBL_10100 [Carabus blaptoides fortunei]